MKSIDALISDADGTLVNTVDLIRHGQYETAKTYFEKHGIPDDEIPNYDTYEAILNQTVGGSARHTLEATTRLLYAATPHHLSNMDFDELHDMLNPIQDRIAPETVHPYPGLTQTFELLGRLGIKLAIFTSGTPHHVVRNFGAAMPGKGLVDLHKDKSVSDTDKLHLFEATVKQEFGIPEFTVVTADDTASHKPNPESLLLAMHRLGVSPNKVAVLGDHNVDMQAGVNANARLRIGITHGFEDELKLKSAGATNIVHSLLELAPILSD